MINLVDNKFLNSDGNRAASASPPPVAALPAADASLDNRMSEAFAGLSFPPSSLSMGGEIEFTSIKDEIEAEDEDLVKVFEKLPEDLKKGCSLKEPKAKSVRAWLSTVPQARLEQFKELDLSHANLSFIPTQISRFTGLKRLDFSHNSITDIAPVLGVPTLTCLSFSHNQVSEIPSLTALTKLQYLSFHSNRMKPADGMLDLFPPKVRSSVALNLAVQDLEKKAPIPNSLRTARTARFDALPEELFWLITKYFFRPGDLFQVSKAWNEATYLTFLEQYKSSSLLNRFIDPSMLPQNPKATLLHVQKKVTDLVKASELAIPFTLDPQKLEQAIHDRSSILLSRAMGYHRFMDQAEANQPSVIRTRMEEGKEGLARAQVLTLKNSTLCVLPKEIRLFTGLQSLYLFNSFIVDITPLNSLTNLITLFLCDNQIQEIEALQPLVKLNQLSLRNNQIKKIESLKSLNLSILDISSNPIENMTGIDCMDRLTELYANYTNISDVSLIGKLAGLTKLNIDGNSIEDIRPLASLKSLKELKASYNQIRNIQPLASLSQLKTLAIRFNFIPASDVNLLEFPEVVRDQLKQNLQCQDVIRLSQRQNNRLKPLWMSS